MGTMRRAERRARKKRYIKANCPQSPKPVSKKMHKGEPMYDFEQRRGACNKRRRIREKQRGWRKRELSGS